MTPDHTSLQQTLLALRARGVFLAVVSRNEGADVEALFRSRPDLIVRLEDFSARAVSWQPKAEGLRAVAAQLRIAPEAMLFVDDNPGELAAVAAAIPELRLLHAREPQETARALGLFPGLHGHPTHQTDALRIADHAAAAVRDELLRQAVDPAEYVRSLDIRLGFTVDDAAAVHRLHNLSNKTNQFNTGLRRFPETEIARRLDDPAYRTVAVALRDRLSDSGIIAVIFARYAGARIVVEEIAISCRALGRSLEDVIVTEALRMLARTGDIREIFVELRDGPRNQPARDWLGRYASGERTDAGYTLSWDAARMAKVIEDAPVSIDWTLQP
jgi:FkbH-like protein